MYVCTRSITNPSVRNALKFYCEIHLSYLQKEMALSVIKTTETTQWNYNLVSNLPEKHCRLPLLSKSAFLIWTIWIHEPTIWSLGVPIWWHNYTILIWIFVSVSFHRLYWYASFSLHKVHPLKLLGINIYGVTIMGSSENLDFVEKHMENSKESTNGPTMPLALRW